MGHWGLANSLEPSFRRRETLEKPYINPVLTLVKTLNRYLENHLGVHLA